MLEGLTVWHGGSPGSFIGAPFGSRLLVPLVMCGALFVDFVVLQKSSGTGPGRDWIAAACFTAVTGALLYAFGYVLDGGSAGADGSIMWAVMSGYLFACPVAYGVGSYRVAGRDLEGARHQTA